MNFLRRLIGQPDESPIPVQDSGPDVVPPAASTSPRSAASVAAASALMDDPADMSDNRSTNEPAAEPIPAPSDAPVSVPADLTAAESRRILDLSDPVTIGLDPGVDSGDGVTRPLPQDVPIENTGMGHAIFGQASDMGQTRTNNEDSVFTFLATSRTAENTPDFGLFVVADGMGGHSEGERASAIAVRTVAGYVLRETYLPLINHEERNTPIAEVVTAAVQHAHEAVQHDLVDGGTTVSVVVLLGDLGYIGHVGDSRIYLIHRGKIDRITRDHSWVQRLIELDQLTPDEANEHPQKNLLYRALGQNDTLEVDTLMRRMPAQARLVLCSDGLWNQVADSDILATVTQAASPQEACSRLIAMANAAGGPDNISVIVLQLPG